MSHAFILDIFLRVLATVGVLLLGAILYYVIPAALAYFFRRITGIEKDYQWMVSRHRDEVAYVHASYWRTTFFLLVYWIIRVVIALGTLFAAFWIWHYDLWYVILGLGIYGLIITFHASDYVRNLVAHMWLLTSGMLKIGQHVTIGTASGVIIDFTAMHVVLADVSLVKTASSRPLYTGGTPTPSVQQLSQGAFAAAMRRQGRPDGNSNGVGTATMSDAGLHYVPNGNVIAYVVGTTPPLGDYGYLESVQRHVE